MTALGHNKPPQHLEHIEAAENLVLEANNWLDGKVAKTDEDAEGLRKLVKLAKAAKKEADAARAAQKKPHDDAGKKVQETYKPILGKFDAIVKTANTALEPWLIEQQRIKQAAAQAAAAEAERLAKEAREAERTDFESKIVAEEKIQAAKDAEKIAKRKERATTVAKGTRTVWKNELVDERAALDWVYDRHKAELMDFVRSLAAGSKVDIPGFRVWSEEVAV